MIVWLVCFLLIVPFTEPYAQVPDFGPRSYLDLRFDRFLLPIRNTSDNLLCPYLHNCFGKSEDVNCSHKCRLTMGLCLTEYPSAKWDTKTPQLVKTAEEVQLPIPPTGCLHGEDHFDVNMCLRDSAHLTLPQNQTFRFRLGALTESEASLTITIYCRTSDTDLNILQRFEGKLQLINPDDVWSTLITQPVMQEKQNESLSIPCTNHTNDTVACGTAELPSVQIKIDYKYACGQHYYGPSCSRYCAPRHSVLGHYRCHPRTGALICDSGWSGTRCNQAICRRGCVHGLCERPEQCRCLDGWTGPTCDQCVPIPGCVNGKCHFNPTLSDWEPYTCECQTGWDGMLCNINKNICSTMKDICQNGGRCLPTPDVYGERPLYTCLCPDGFQGTHCERKIPDCRYHGCGTNGTCKADGNCTCPNGYYGSECQFNQTDCSESPCMGKGSVCLMTLKRENMSTLTNHSSQLNHNLPFECHCEVGRFGTNCEFEKDWCATIDPCFNGGRCVNRQGGYVCVCPPNFTGTRCDQAQVACRNDSCANGGECLDHKSYFSCHCPLGWTGLTCRENVNECAEIPRLTGRALCAQGAGCRDLLGSYQCLCPPGWTGRHCELAEEHVIQPDNGSFDRNTSDCTMNPKPSHNGSHFVLLQTSVSSFAQTNQQSIRHVFILFTVLGIAIPLTLIALVAGILLLISNCHPYARAQCKAQWPESRSRAKNDDDQTVSRIPRYTADTKFLPQLLPDCLTDNTYHYPSKQLHPHFCHKPLTKCEYPITKSIDIVTSDETSYQQWLMGSGAKKKSSLGHRSTTDLGADSPGMDQARFPYRCVHSYHTPYPPAVDRFPYTDHTVINPLTLFSPSSARAYSPPPPYEEQLTVSVNCEQEQ